MRASVRKDDPGYSPDAFMFRVLVDGGEIRHCFTADEELGVAYCYGCDERGRVLLDPNHTDRALEIEIRGDVQIVARGR